MDKIRRFDADEVMNLARRAVRKVDTLGPRGTTLCTMEEIEAMAVLLVASGALVTPARDLSMTRAERYGSLTQAIQPTDPDT